MSKINFKTCEMFDGNWVTIKTQENFDQLFEQHQSQGLARFKDNKGCNWVNKNGYELTDKRYYRTGNFTNDFAWVRFDDMEYSWVNLNGEELTEKRYKDVSVFIQGFAWFCDDKGQGYINTFGFEFKSDEFTWKEDSYEKDYENNKEELFKLEEKLYGFSRDSMKYYILTKVLT